VFWHQQQLAQHIAEFPGLFSGAAERLKQIRRFWTELREGLEPLETSGQQGDTEQPGQIAVDMDWLLVERVAVWRGLLAHVPCDHACHGTKV